MESIDQINPILRLSGATSFFVISLISAALNIILLVTMGTDFKEHKKSSFLMFILQLVICALIDLSTQFIIVIPTVYTGSDVSSSDALYKEVPLFYYTLTTLDSVAYSAFVVFSFLLTLNRLFVFVFPRWNDQLFESPMLYWSVQNCIAKLFFRTIFSGWSISLAIHICRTWIGIRKEYLTNRFVWENLKTLPLNEIELAVDNIQKFVTYYTPLTMLLIYIAIFVYLKLVRPKNQSQNSKRADYMILLQSFLICGSIAIEALAFKYTPAIPSSGQWKFVINFIQNCITIFLYTSNPVVLYIFNTEIRISMKHLLKRIGFKHEISSTNNIVTCPNSSNNIMIRSSIHINRNPH